MVGIHAGPIGFCLPPGEQSALSVVIHERQRTWSIRASLASELFAPISERAKTSVAPQAPSIAAARLHPGGVDEEVAGVRSVTVLDVLKVRA